ncbi:MAG: hypothetical protein KBT82_19015 [Marinobacter sp.]|uniref:hypothetical protein n=1 Tax=Marinobacter sp. TaxID=50741 RepID=UPI001B49D9BE|nr:hypothetical protein [Marinobacter sp.]MBQ0745040.1 hypothetical protein [Marinobacter sp.]MBQ0816233.1 hypothetical protein [Marinobacter sp.]|tara:strand:- start:3427 stop:3831 length:405 start_codon:yes stop_codon:yes gene_type:complete
MKSYIALIAGLALAGASVVYAADDEKMKSDDKATTSEQHSSQGKLSSMDPDKLEGMNIHNDSKEEIGDIDEIVKDKSGRHMAVIGLKNSMKEVAVPLDTLSMSSDGETLTTSMSQEELLALPDYDPMDMESADD